MKQTFEKWVDLSETKARKVISSQENFKEIKRGGNMIDYRDSELTSMTGALG